LPAFRYNAGMTGGQQRSKWTIRLLCLGVSFGSGMLLTAFLIGPSYFLWRTVACACGLFSLGGSAGVLVGWLLKNRNKAADWFLATGSISISLVWLFAFRFYGEAIAAIWTPVLERHAGFLSDLAHFRW
jgi:hypothetical protein